jgi:hypothetical protein
MQAPVYFPGSLYLDYLPTGEFACTVLDLASPASEKPAKHVLTHLGPVSVPPGDDRPMYNRCRPGDFRVASKAHQGFHTWVWSAGSGWEEDPRFPNGEQPHIWTPSGELFMVEAKPDAPSTGITFWDGPSNQPVYEWQVHGPESTLSQAMGVTRLYRWTYREGVFVGQGDIGGCVVFYQGKHYLLEAGLCDYVQFYRDGRRLVISMTKFAEVRTVKHDLMVEDIPGLPLYGSEQPAPPERPRVTISSYTPQSGTVPPDLAVRAVAQLSGGPATKLLWSQQRDGGAWQVVAPDNAPDDPDHTYRFSQPGSYGLRVRVEGPGGSDETGTPRIVTVTPAEPDPGPVPQPERRFWFGPNIGSLDMLQLFTEDELWPEARKHVGVYQFYTQNVIDVGGPIGPNSYAALRDAQAFRKVKNWGMLTAVEMGSVKAGATWECDASANIARITEVQQRIAEAGGRLDVISMDEPLVSGPECHQSVAETAVYVARYIRTAKQAGLQCGWVEAWPHVTLDKQAEFLQELDRNGARPDFWHLDVDWKRAKREGTPFDSSIVAEFRRHADERLIPLGIILIGDVHDTDAEYVNDVKGWAQQCNTLWHDWPHVKVQSWATRGENGPFDIPANTPETDESKHTSLFQFAVELFS